MQERVRPALAFLIVVAVLTAVSASADVLYGSTRSGVLFTVNLATGQGTPIGHVTPCHNVPPFQDGVTEIEYDPATGRSFAQGSDGSFCGSTFTIAGGATIATVNDSASLSGMEVINGTWYATTIAYGPNTTLVTLNPATGALTPIGSLGIGDTPVSGLAWNGTTLYGITGGSGAAQLYTINRSTGAATLVGSTGIQAGSLEFGPDGLLYAGGTGGGGQGPVSASSTPRAQAPVSTGNIYRINPATGASTLVGPTGFAEGITGLMLAPLASVPTFSMTALIALAATLMLAGVLAVRSA